MAIDPVAEVKKMRERIAVLETGMEVQRQLWAEWLGLIPTSAADVRARIETNLRLIDAALAGGSLDEMLAHAVVESMRARREGR